MTAALRDVVCRADVRSSAAAAAPVRTSTDSHTRRRCNTYARHASPRDTPRNRIELRLRDVLRYRPVIAPVSGTGLAPNRRRAHRLHPETIPKLVRWYGRHCRSGYTGFRRVLRAVLHEQHTRRAAGPQRNRLPSKDFFELEGVRGPVSLVSP